MALPKIAYPTIELTVPTTGAVALFRPFLVKEEKILLMAKSAADSNPENAGKELLRAAQHIVGNCALDPAFDVEKLALVDLEWLFLRLRAASVDNVIKLAYKDEEDAKVYEFSVDLDKIEVDQTKTLPKVIDVNESTKLGLRYPRAALVLTADVVTPEVEFERLLVQTLDWVSVGGKPVDLANADEKELHEFIDSIPAKVLDKIKAFWEAVPTMQHVIKYTNTKGTERVITLQTLNDFFIF